MKGISSERVQPYQSYFKWNSSMHNHHHCCFIIASFNHISDGIKIFMIIITIYYYNSSSASYSSSKGFPIYPLVSVQLLIYNQTSWVKRFEISFKFCYATTNVMWVGLGGDVMGFLIQLKIRIKVCKVNLDVVGICKSKNNKRKVIFRPYCPAI